MRLKTPSVARVRRVARKLAERQARRNDTHGMPLKPMRKRAHHGKIKRIVAYDLETTPIKNGTPIPVYLTAYGEDFQISTPINSLDHLASIIVEYFLTEDERGTRFVAWNGNKFDGYLFGLALLRVKGFEIIPYLAKGSMLRGFKVVRKNERHGWEFLDGISMTGIVETPLKTQFFADGAVRKKGFLAVFAPEYDWVGGPDFKKGEHFDASNAEHVRYAERDSEGLYKALMHAQQILLDTFGVSLQTTIGNAGIKIFQQEMPDGVNVWAPSFRAEMAIREHVYRGGYCHLKEKYAGPVWKYDLNQAYAAAMRECDLPAGRSFAVQAYKPDYCGVYRIVADIARNPIPFYYKPQPLVGEYADTKLTDTWITSTEYEQLQAEGWRVQVIEGVVWEDKFRMTEFVRKLEKLRMSAADGPSGALGTMMKALGNTTYGKTVERLDGLEFRLAVDKPDGFSRSIPTEEDNALPYLWYAIKKPILRPYHQPQIGAFITAYVRMVVRRAALSGADAFVYADTDCIVFTRPVDLPIDPKRYGFWKRETDGQEYAFITKKVYFSRADFEHTRKAKGLHLDKLTFDDFTRWFAGQPPRQNQLQRVNFLKALTGSEMFVERLKWGQLVA